MCITVQLYSILKPKRDKELGECEQVRLFTSQLNKVGSDSINGTTLIRDKTKRINYTVAAMVTGL